MRKDGYLVHVEGFRLPLFPGRYRILVEGIHYGMQPDTRGLGDMIDRVHEALADPYKRPEKVAILVR